MDTALGKKTKTEKNQQLQQESRNVLKTVQNELIDLRSQALCFFSKQD